MKIKQKTLLTLILCCCTSTAIMAQIPLNIEHLFEQYGKQKGVTIVELRGETFGGYKFSLFKSITITDNSKAADFARQCIEKERQNAKKIKEITVNGTLQSVFLELPKQGYWSRLMLFNETAKSKRKITIIYIESEENSEDILKFILKKK